MKLLFLRKLHINKARRILYFKAFEHLAFLDLRSFKKVLKKGDNYSVGRWIQKNGLLFHIHHCICKNVLIKST
jgi:hypothetical protein